MANPPGIISSLLPAPQQAILNADMEKSYAALYRPMDATTETTVSTPVKASSLRKTFERETVPEQRPQENTLDESEEVDETEDEENENDDEDTEDDE